MPEERLSSFSLKSYGRRGTLLWLTPILVASGIELIIWFNPASIKDQLFFPVVIIFGIIAPVGGLWGIYQSIRYEKSPWKYVAIIVLVPFGFVWYYFERYRKRTAASARDHEQQAASP